MPDGPAKAGVVREAVRLADFSRDSMQQFYTRIEFIEATFFSGTSPVFTHLQRIVSLSHCRSRESFPK